MFIEVFHKGTFVNRHFIDIPEIATNGIKDDQLSFKERFEAKEKTVLLLIEDFKANKLPGIYRKSPDVQLAIIFQSSMGEKAQTKKPIKDIQRNKLSEKENAVFVRPKGEYSNPQLPEDILPKEGVNKTKGAVLKQRSLKPVKHRPHIYNER